ncbi:TetR/AcrR family transcriptional regulator [Pseudohalioglobus sediminis]|uniref:TetR/AcrR family transcriptional regulator n=1 Tax=Pseudohalioglobus sediminis TaxID=2606449 RepID=A0A5B0X750_9GAMM|nr:TetR/AcrR family transcriptional regulator [Pseudohalioglobus sediminis]KAA1194287.1 TetR/AcrR family transcriptional regulator [Pseudohalioglobus sediminis]
MAEKSTYHHGDLRRTLLDQAAGLLREEGEKGLSMRALAARAGVSRTAPYHHFADKQQLLCAIAEEGFRRFVGVLRIESAALSEQRLQQFVRNYLEFAVNNAEYYDLMFGSQLWKSGHISSALQDEAHSSFRFYVAQVRAWQDQQRISPTLDALRYAQVTWSTLHGMCRLLIDGIYLDTATMGPMCDQAGSMFWRELQVP